MKLPISKRLLACAELVPACDCAADVGADHGYLGIHLLLEGRCRRVITADLREKPLASARENARLFGVTDRMRFLRSDGLDAFEPGSFQTLILAGMGGDLMQDILRRAPWLKQGAYTLILQPQSSQNELRGFLGREGYGIERELLCADGQFLYEILQVLPGTGRPLSPGEQYLSPALRRENDPLFGRQLARIRRALELTVAGISRSCDPADRERLSYYRQALDEILSLNTPDNPDMMEDSP